MGLWGNLFPYTNFHELNLDWILDTLKKLAEKVEEMDERLSSEIKELAATVEELKEALETIVDPEKLQNLLKQVDENTDNIKTLALSVLNLQSGLMNAESDISALKDDVSSLESNVNAEIVKLKQKDDAQQTVIDELNNNVSNIQVNIEAIRNDIGGIQQDVSSLKGSVNSIKTQITSIQQDISTLQSDTNALKNRADDTDSAIGSLNTNVSDLKTKVAANTLSIQTLNESSIGFEGDLTGLSTKVTQLETSQSAQDSKIGSLETGYNSLVSKTDNTNIVIAGIQEVDNNQNSNIQNLNQQMSVIQNKAVEGVYESAVDLGMVCDGVTDDSDAFKSAILAGHYAIYVPSGKALSIQKMIAITDIRYICLSCQGNGIIAFEEHGGISYNQHLILQHCYVQGHSNVVEPITANNITASDSIFAEFFQTVFSIKGFAQIINCFFYGVQGVLMAYPYITNVMFTNNIVHLNENVNYCFKVDANSNLYLTNNIFELNNSICLIQAPAGCVATITANRILNVHYLLNIPVNPLTMCFISNNNGLPLNIVNNPAGIYIRSSIYSNTWEYEYNPPGGSSMGLDTTYETYTATITANNLNATTSAQRAGNFVHIKYRGVFNNTNPTITITCPSGWTSYGMGLFKMIDDINNVRDVSVTIVSPRTDSVILTAYLLTSSTNYTLEGFFVVYKS